MFHFSDLTPQSPHSSSEAPALTVRASSHTTRPPVDCKVARVELPVPIMGAWGFSRLIIGAASLRFSGILALAASFVTATSTLLHGQTIAAISPEIVSAWKLTGGNAVLIFRYDGIYQQIQTDASQPGMERGTFAWNKTTGAFTAVTQVDTNGTLGLSHPVGAASMSISGDTLTYAVAGGASTTYSRVVATSSAIVGSWFLPIDQITLTFLADGTYYGSEEKNDIPSGADGIERGTYAWNSSTKILTASLTTDTNGTAGLSSIPAGFTATISGNTMTVTLDGETFALQRINSNPAIRTDFSFTVEKFTNSKQTSDTTPTLLTGPPEDTPFWGEAYIEHSVSGSGGTLTIGTQAARNFVDDTAWSIETEYSTLAQLNASAAFPNGVNYVFKRGTGNAATLTFPSSGTFSNTPKIISGDNGSWSGGKYVLSDDKVLIWTPKSSYDPNADTTWITVTDVASSTDLIKEYFIPADVSSFDFTGKLVQGHTYEVQIEHVKIAASTTSGTGVFSNKLGYAIYNSNTRFLMKPYSGVNVAHSITSQPVSSIVALNAKANLTVGINENPDVYPEPRFQWFKNNVAVPGQTGNSLTIGSYSDAANAGTYTVKVTNVAGSVTSAPATLGPAIVELVAVGKQIQYIQNGPSTVIVDPSPVEPDYGGPYEFSAHVEGQNMGLLAAPTVTPPSGTAPPFYNTLSFDSEIFKWRYGPTANDSGVLSQSANDFRFPNGTYTFIVNGVSIPLVLTGDAYPNTPQLTLSGGTWVNGKYAMDAANALTVTTNAFTGYNSNIDGHISLDVDDLGIELFKSSSPATNFATYTVPSNTLSPNQVTEVWVGFDAIVSKSNALSGAYCAAFFSKSVELEVHFLPKIISQSSSQVLLPNSSVNLQVSATGSPATASGQLDYQWKKNGVNILGSTNPSFGITTFTLNDSGSYTCTITNDVGSVTSLPIHLEFSDAFQAYTASYGLNSVTTGAPDADSDKDGIANLLEYLLGGNPVLPNFGLLPTLSTTPISGGRNLIFSYKRKLAATGVTQVIQSSSSLSSIWTPAVHGQNGVTIVTALVPGDSSTEQVTATIPMAGGKGFVRLRANH